LILDKNNGRQLYSTQETVLQSCPGVRFIPLVDEGKLIVDFQFWSLAFKFTAPK
jgi:hypothetical protein